MTPLAANRLDFDVAANRVKRFENIRSTQGVIPFDYAKEFMKWKSSIITMFDKLNNEKHTED